MSQNRYEVLGKIADGGLGSVFKAYDRNLRREVALKRVRADSPEEAERQAEQLFEEARTISTLQHPHIVTVFDVGKDEEGAFIVMELLKGETLEDIIQRGALNEGDFRELVTQSLEGMMAAHATGLIHLDIKPQNFMVIWLPSGKFQIKILDFGLAKLSSHPQVQDVDDDGAVMGSIYFMAPEQFERSPVDARTDLYSLGCVFYFALTQHYPFQGETGPEVMASHMYHSFIPLAQMRPDLPAQTCAWVEWLMNRDPNLRPEAVSQAHEWFQAGQAPTFESPVTEAEAIALAEPDDEDYIATALPDEEAPPATPSQPIPPRIVRPGGLRPSAPRPTRPVPGVPSGPVGTRPVPKPVIRPVNIVSAAAPEHLRYKAAMPKWLTVGVPVFLILAVGGFFALKWKKDSDEKNRFNVLVRQTHDGPAPGTLKDLSLMIRFLEDKELSQAAGEVIGKLNAGEQADAVVANAVRTVRQPWARKNLALAIAARASKPALEPLIDQLERTKEADVRLAIWQALARIATPADVSRLLELHNADKVDEEIRAAEGAIINAARQEPNLTKRSAAILQAYKSSAGTDEIRASLLRILGKLGSPESIPVLTSALESPNASLRNNAAFVLKEWPNAEPIAALIAFLPKAKDPYIHKNAIDSIGSLAPLSGEVPQEGIVKPLIDAFNASKDSREQTSALNALGRVAHPDAAAFCQSVAARDPRNRDAANNAVKSINGALAKIVEIGDGAELLPDKAELARGPLGVKDGVILNFFSLADQVNWVIMVDKPGTYEVQVSQAYAGSKPGRYSVTLGKAILPRPVEKTSSNTAFKAITVGSAQITKPGRYRLWVRPEEIAPGDYLFRLQKVTLKRTGA
jgi:serine/threonine protein kinase/HEAT repeat protein